MTRKQPTSLVLHDPLEPRAPPPLPRLELQHLYFRISDHSRALALVPVDTDIDAWPLAQDLAHVAASLPDSHVLAVNASTRRCRPGEPVARARAQPALDHLRPTAESPGASMDVIDFSLLPRDDADLALTASPQLLDCLAIDGRHYGVALFAVDSPLAQTRCIPLLRSLASSVLLVALGRTRFAEVRQLLQLLGPERVLGAVALR